MPNSTLKFSRNSNLAMANSIIFKTIKTYPPEISKCEYRDHNYILNLKS